MSDFYTVEEAADALNVPLATMKKLISQKRIEVIELDSKNKRISKDALKNIKPAKKVKRTSKPATPAQIANRQRFAEMGRARKAEADKRKAEADKVAPPDEATKPKANGAAKAVK